MIYILIKKNERKGSKLDKVEFIKWKGNEKKQLLDVIIIKLLKNFYNKSIIIIF